MGKLNSFAKGFEIGTRIADSWEAARLRNALKEAGSIEPKERRQYTEDQAADIENMYASGKLAPNAVVDEVFKAVPPRGEVYAYSLGDAIQDTPFTQEQVNAARMAKMAEVYDKFGRPDVALSLRNAVTAAERDAKRFAWEEARSKQEDERFKWAQEEAARNAERFAQEQRTFEQQQADRARDERHRAMYEAYIYITSGGSPEGLIPFLERAGVSVDEGTLPKIVKNQDGSYGLSAMVGGKEYRIGNIKEYVMSALPPAEWAKFQAEQQVRKEELKLRHEHELDLLRQRAKAEKQLAEYKLLTEGPHKAAATETKRTEELRKALKDVTEQIKWFTDNMPEDSPWWWPTPPERKKAMETLEQLRALQAALLSQLSTIAAIKFVPPNTSGKQPAQQPLSNKQPAQQPPSNKSSATAPGLGAAVTKVPRNKQPAYNNFDAVPSGSPFMADFGY